ncbi:hypothetical protein [Lactobacillus sp. Sy-1]|uniref:hypothetical protein n=1 Tax=Lactobacillus sp. Sy-1 TaxID=2109645 RepID=UPI001C5B4108|nr:hypothetical protein [Lactobacillus sp. Sy-1]MBW1606099.1 hypothetical protein [Lactobacillus sp. Sy-1]
MSDSTLHKLARHGRWFSALLIIIGLALIALIYINVNSGNVVTFNIGGEIVLIILSFWAAIKIWGAQRVAAQQDHEEFLRQQAAEKAYIDSIKPANTVSYTTLDIEKQDVVDYLGQGDRTVKYMFIDRDRAVTFPESTSGNNVKYYLTEIDFTPDIQTVISGSTTNFGQNYNSGLNNGLNNTGNSTSFNTFGNSYNRGTFNGQTRTVEHKTSALITLVTTTLDRSFKIQINDVESDKIDSLKHYYLLNDFELKKFGLK